jgi:hypothetical protein
VNLNKRRPAQWLATTAAMLMVASGAIVGVGSAAHAEIDGTASAPMSADGVTPYIIDGENPGGNITCEEVGEAFFGDSGHYTGSTTRNNYDKDTDSFADPWPTGLNVTVTADTSVAFTSTFKIGAVIVKGGDAANNYVYVPQDNADSGLAAPPNASDGSAGLSNLTFCWRYEVAVSKTANTSYKRTYSWDIDKSADTTDVVLSPGQSYLVNYTVDVTSSYVDSDWAVAGKITITNPDPNNPAKVANVTDVISDGLNATVDCGAVPFTIDPGGTKECSYARALPDGTSRVNTATVTMAADSKVDGGSATASVTFGAPTTKVDECVQVVDDQYGELASNLCANATPKSFTYSMYVGPYEECGTYEFVNTAEVRRNASTLLAYDSWTVNVDVPCAEGCTLTQGYWKTHSAKGPAPYDDGWLQIGAAGQDTTFYLSGKSWYGVFWTPLAGNPYYNLAHQYMAAKLNVLNGASSTPEVTAALASAESLFATYTPTQVGSGSKALKKQFTELASLLDRYNNGLVGPGHCSENSYRTYLSAA